MLNLKRLGLLVPFLVACSTPASSVSQQSDPYLWLEKTGNPEVKDWAAARSKKTSGELTTTQRYQEIVPQIRKIFTAKDRIPYGSYTNGMVRNFWQDQKSVRGLWRQTTRAEYAKKIPKWETLIDVDALNKAEKKSFVWKGVSCLPPEENDCLVQLSNGGGDKVIVREFDVSTRSFVPNGFVLPEGKHDFAWMDRDTLIIGTDWGAATLTDSGYPRQVRLWKRGTPLGSAKLIFEGKKSDVSVAGFKSFRPEGNHTFIVRSIAFFQDQMFLVDEEGRLQKLPFPETASFTGVFKEFIFERLRKDWQTPLHQFTAGSLISLPISKIAAPDFEKSLELVYEPDSRSTLTQVVNSKSHTFLNLLTNVKSRIREVSHTASGWILAPLNLPSSLPETGKLSISDSDPYTDLLLLDYQNFTVPPQLSELDAEKPQLTLKLLKTLPSRYDSRGVVVEQFEGTSRDGTKVPYFVVHKKGIALDGSHPTLLSAYGGFEATETPYYLGATGKIWIEKGGIFALANIRGGGEFGPRWHEAALKKNRQRAYDDFFAVTEDLIARKITSPRHLGIMGGSNGGLLVGVAFTQHPEYYRAVICESALLDMLRYTKLPPGASWIGEYGDPNDPNDADMAHEIAKYSPYQNLKSGVKYPRVLFHISTEDDRVLPGHTRKMVAKMESLGNEVLLYENAEGGHGGAADIEQRIKKTGLEYSYLFQML